LAIAEAKMEAHTHDPEASVTENTALVVEYALRGLARVNYIGSRLGATSTATAAATSTSATSTGAADMAIAALGFAERLLANSPEHEEGLQIAAELSMSAGGGVEASAGHYQQLVGVLEKKHHKLVAVDTGSGNAASGSSEEEGGEKLRAAAGQLAEVRVAYGLALKRVAAGMGDPDTEQDKNKKRWVEQESESQYRQAIRIAPSMAEAHAHLGVGLMSLRGDIKGAILSYQTAIALKPDLIEAHSNLGVAYHTLAGTGTADAGASVTAHGLLGQAAASYSNAIAIAPGSAASAIVNANFNLGAVFFAQKRVAEARGAFQRVVHLQPTHATAVGALAQLDAAIAAAAAGVEAQQTQRAGA
jgi:TolA-binding protein